MPNSYVRKKKSLLITHKQDLQSIRKEFSESKLAPKRLMMRIARLKKTRVGYLEDLVQKDLGSCAIEWSGSSGAGYR